MKIDVTCTNCRALLRVSSEHAGKQVRCPSCGSLSQIPLAGEFGGPLPGAEPSHAEFQTGYSMRSDSRSTGEQPTTSPLHPSGNEPIYVAGRNPEYPQWRQTVPRLVDGQDKKAMILGGLAIASIFLCGCFTVVVTPALSIPGFILANSSSGPNRRGAMVLNLIAIGIWILASLFWMAIFVMN